MFVFVFILYIFKEIYKLMKVNYRFLAVAAISLGLLWSCKKTDEGNTSKDSLVFSEKGVTLENGYLKFSDQKSFDSISTVLISKQGVDLDAWEARFSGFKSYRTIFKNIQDEYEKVNSSESFQAFKNKYNDLVTIKSDSSLTYKFGTPLSALFTNAKGEVKIGEDLKIYTNDGRIVSSANGSKATQNAISVPLIGRLFLNTYYNGDSKRRLHVELWYDEATGANPRQQQGRFYLAVTQEGTKTFGGWGANETDLSFRNIYCPIMHQSYELLLAPIRYDYRLTSYDAKDFKGTFIVDMGRMAGYGASIYGSGSINSRGVPSAPQLDFALTRVGSGGWVNPN